MFFHLDDLAWAVSIIAILLCCTFLIWATRKKRLWIRNLGLFSGASVGSVASLLLLLFVLELASGCNTHGTPIYSPDRKSAALVWTYDAGATGGGTSVRVYSTHGLRTSRVYTGPWESVGDNSLEWNDVSHLTIHYASGLGEITCENATTVQVNCVSSQ